ncbi:hypothetical protein NMY22_g3487 [Coprinellus aureogranulatus]|nr:hypothetical protein NMY22_g3487 [Coprinellus aureogranulatus]
MSLSPHSGSSPHPPMEDTCHLCQFQHAPSFPQVNITLDLRNRVLGSSPSMLVQLANSCPIFRDILSLILLGQVKEALGRHGIGSPLDFLNFCDFNNCVIAGTLPLVALHSGFYGENFVLELHGPKMGSLASIVAHMEQEGFMLSATHSEYSTISSHISSFLGYPGYGRTVSKLLHFKKEDENNRLYHCVFILNNCTYSHLPSILELPSTALMNMVHKHGISILYPSLTSARHGLLNLPPAYDIGHSHTLSFLTNIGFHLASTLEALDHHQYQHHRCGEDPSCPARTRESLDGLSLTVPFRFSATISEPSMPNIVWKLRCAQGCASSMRMPMHPAAMLPFIFSPCDPPYSQAL